MIRAASLALALVGCSPVAVSNDRAWGENDVPRTRESGGRCRAEGLDAFLGRRADKAVTEDAQRRSGASRLRVIGPDTVVTADYREDRLNIEVDARRIITRLACY